MSGNIVWHNGMNTIYSNSSGNVFSGQLNITFDSDNYTDEFIVSDELKIEHMDIETGEIEFKKNPNYINWNTHE